MKKNVLLAVLVVLIVYTVYSTITIQRLNKDYSQKVDSLTIVRSELETTKSLYQVFFSFDWITIHPHFPQFVLKGDSLIGDISITAGNSISRSDELKEAYVVLCEDIDENFKAIGVYDSIPADEWRCKVKIKTDKIGVFQLKGMYYMPQYDGSYMPFPFENSYQVCDSTGIDYKDLKNFYGR